MTDLHVLLEYKTAVGARGASDRQCRAARRACFITLCDAVPVIDTKIPAGLLFDDFAGSLGKSDGHAHKVVAMLRQVGPQAFGDIDDALNIRLIQQFQDVFAVVETSQERDRYGNMLFIRHANSLLG
jgi:hypothetical protein